MDLDPILSALSKLEQSINDRYNDLNDRYNDLNNKITILNEKVDSILSIANCDKSLDLLSSDPNIEREQRAKQKYFTYWLLETCKDKTRLVTKCF